MGRQHTIYLSDASWDKLMMLKKDNESMSSAVRESIDLSVANIADFELMKRQFERIQVLKNYNLELVKTITDIADLYENKVKFMDFYHQITQILERDGHIEDVE